MINIEPKSNRKHIEKVQKTVYNTKTLKGAKTWKVNFDITALEFYHVQFPSLPFQKGVVCAVDNNVMIWSNEEKALQHLLYYLKAGKENILDIEQFINLYKLFEMNMESIVISEEDIEYYHNIQRGIDKNLSAPIVKKPTLNTITYFFWVYSLSTKQLDFYECNINKESELTIKINGVESVLT